MPEENKNLNFNEEEISKLRNAVLKWVDKKNEVEKSQPKKTFFNKEKNKVEKPKQNPESSKKEVDKKMQNKKTETKKIPEKPVIKENKTTEPKSKKIKILIYFILFVLLTSLLFGTGLSYFKWQNPIIKKITKYIPYPVAIVNFKIITYYDWERQVEALQNFYQKQLDQNPKFEFPTKNQTYQHVLDRMIEQKLIEQLALDYQVNISQEEINNQILEITEEIGGEDALSDQLKELYNWTIEDFKKEIIRPFLIKDKLSLAITLDDRINSEARSKAEEILKMIKNKEDTFEEIAKKYSEDATAVNGGNLGYFSLGQMVPEFEKVAFALQPGEVSDIVKTRFGYHIIKVEEKLTNEEGNVTQIGAKHILIRSKSLEEYLEEFKNESHIWPMLF